MAAQERQPARICHGAAQRSRPRNTRPATESDKDSGYSDVASECLSSVEQTDTEEGPQTSRWGAGDNPHPAPLLVLKNVLVDQGSGADPRLHSWTVRPSFQLLPTSSQILVFPPSVSPAKPAAAGRKPTKYLPILSSYTKIAPNPPPLPAGSALPRGNKRRGADSWHHSQEKRPLSGPPSSGAKGQVKAQEGQATPHNDTGADADGGDPRASHDPSQKAALSVPAQNKSRRFQNTLEVLHRSGLLTIAMKTKELARLNQATQVQLERLQQQVALYTQAVGSNNTADWQALQDSLTGGNTPPKEITM